jgi:hypothetical protein
LELEGEISGPVLNGFPEGGILTVLVPFAEIFSEDGELDAGNVPAVPLTVCLDMDADIDAAETPRLPFETPPEGLISGALTAWR